MAGYVNNANQQNTTDSFKQADAFLNVSFILTNKSTGETKEVSVPKGIPLFEDTVIGKKLISMANQDSDWQPELVGKVFIKGSNKDSLDGWE